MKPRGQAPEGHTMVDGDAPEDDADYVPDDEFVAAGRAVAEQYSELMRRLAQ
ncbi:hypothetical protein [Pseudokineococcus sp. 1T1Z-3]|uniref:hypothetical protein n=1 Tax=Pseudokineococcus sp. 1T1Z-3 TaxID=3132745 RepID=UPI0030A98A79